MPRPSAMTTLLATVLMVSTGFWKNAKAVGTYHSYIETPSVTPIYYPKTDPYYGSTTNDRTACKESYNDPDGDCITGRAGVDYPVFTSIPETDFSCKRTRDPGYYADVDAHCQVFHICEANGRQHSVLCPKGTVFNQEVLVCDWWYNVDCFASIYHYEKNAHIYDDRPDPPQSRFGAHTSAAPEPYEEDEYYYDVAEQPLNGYNRRIDTPDESPTTTEPTTTSTEPPVTRPRTTTARNIAAKQLKNKAKVKQGEKI